MATADPEAGRKESVGAGPGGGPSDIHRLSRCGNSLYELLDLPKESTNEEIRRKYRRLALKYHPDKNPDNPEAEEMFKKINHANSILSDEKKREIYDQYGSFGLYVAEQFGDEVVDHVMLFSSKWFQCIFWSCCLLTGCFFCCCGFCCCCMCCGKCKPKEPDDSEVPDVAEFEEDNQAGETNQQSGSAAQADPVTVQPKSTNEVNAGSSDAIVLPPPTYDETPAPNKTGDTDADESTALNNGDKVGYTPDMTTNTTPKKVPSQT